MKTKKIIRALANLKILMVVLVIAAAVALFSCGKNKSKETAKTEIAPPLVTPPVAPASDSVYITVDEFAQFPNGEQGLMKFIFKNTVYPDDAKKNNIQGKVLVGFVVEKDCSISEVEIVKSVNPSLDAEALRVVKALPRFEKPAKQDGNPVRVQYMLPINFKLN